MIDVQQSPLSSFEENSLLLSQRILHECACICDILPQLPAVAYVFALDCTEVKFVRVAICIKDSLLQRYEEFEFVGEDVLVYQVSHPDAQPRDLVCIGRPNPTSCRADFGTFSHPLLGTVQYPVIRHDDVRPVADPQILRAHSTRLEVVQFLDEDSRVDDHSVPDDSKLARPQDAGRKMMQREQFLADFDGVPSVVPSLESHDHVGLVRQEIDNLTFALISPLRAYDY